MAQQCKTRDKRVDRKYFLKKLKKVLTMLENML